MQKRFDKTFLVLSDSYQVDGKHPLEDCAAVICLFWAAPSTLEEFSIIFGTPCYGLLEIVSSYMNWTKLAYDLTSQVAQAGPSYRSFFWRTCVFEDLYLEALELVLLALVVKFVHSFVNQDDVTQLQIKGDLSSSSRRIIEALCNLYPNLNYESLNSSQEVAPLPWRLKIPLWKKLEARWAEVRLTRNWKKLFGDMVDWVDKDFRFRYLLGRLRRRSRIIGGITFFSSYTNNSVRLSAFESCFQSPVNWVFTMPNAKLGVSTQRKRISWLWQYRYEKRTLQVEEDGEYPEFQCPDGLTIDAQVFNEWLDNSRIWNHWRNVSLSLTSRLTLSWEEYLGSAKPRLVLVGNQWGIERWFSQMARSHGIPVVQIMHGLMSGYLHTQTAIQSDLMVVPGEYWRELWPESELSRIVVLNPQNGFPKIPKKQNALRTLTFFSWPYFNLPYYNEYEIVPRIVRILANVIHSGFRVIYRVHPLENAADIISFWKAWQGDLPKNLQIDRLTPIDSVIAETDVALMFQSTVILNCVSSGIPVVIPAWIDFSCKEGLREIPLIYLAGDYPELESTIMSQLRTVSAETVPNGQRFVNEPDAGVRVFMEEIEKLLHSRRG